MLSIRRWLRGFGVSHTKLLLFFDIACFVSNLNAEYAIPSEDHTVHY